MGIKNLTTNQLNQNGYSTNTKSVLYIHFPSITLRMIASPARDLS